MASTDPHARRNRPQILCSNQVHLRSRRYGVIGDTTKQRQRLESKTRNDTPLRRWTLRAKPYYYWEAAAVYGKLKRHSDEIALIRRFANNHDIDFRAFSKRYRSTWVATYDWATKFLERIDAARLAATTLKRKTSDCNLTTGVDCRTVSIRAAHSQW